PTFIDQQSHALNTSPRTPLGLGLATLTAYGGGIARGDLFLWTGAALITLALLGLLHRDFQATTLGLLLWLFPLGLVLLLGLRSGLFDIRYLVVGLIGLTLVSGVGIVCVAHYQAF